MPCSLPAALRSRVREVEDAFFCLSLNLSVALFLSSLRFPENKLVSVTWAPARIQSYGFRSHDCLKMPFNNGWEKFSQAAPLFRKELPKLISHVPLSRPIITREYGPVFRKKRILSDRWYCWHVGSTKYLSKNRELVFYIYLICSFACLFSLL